MARKKVKVYIKFNNNEENYENYAIIIDNVIKYIDFENNKMTIDLNNSIIIRANSDFTFNIDFVKNKIDIYLKKHDKYLKKDIKTIILEKKKTSFLVRYLLVDEKEYNEYYIIFK